MKICLFFVKPLLAFGMGVAVMAIFRRIAIGPIDLVALAADVILLG